MPPILIFLCVLLVSSAYVGLIVWLVHWARNRYGKQHRETQKDISDVELFRLMTKCNHFITAEQLAEVSGIDTKVANKRLWYLAFQKVVTGYYDAGGSQQGVFQLPESVPLEAIPKMKVEQMSDREVVRNILTYAQDYQVTIAELVVIFDIDIHQAKALLKRLLKSKLVSRLRKGVRRIYVIDRSVRIQRNFSIHEKSESQLQKSYKDIKKMAIPSAIPTDGRIKIPDAEVIQYAIENNGRLTPTLLCLKSKISIEEAKRRLEQLYEQGTFVMNVDESNYVMEYQLRDQSLLD